MSTILLETELLLCGDGTPATEGWVELDHGVITAVGRGDAGPERRDAASLVIREPGHAVMPGFINAHTHLFQTYLRGLRDDLVHSEWNNKVIGDNVGKLHEEDFYLAALLGSVESLLAGYTTIVDNHYVHTSPKNTDRVAEALTESGIRAWLARGTLDRRDVIERTTGPLAAAANTEPVDQALSELERVAAAWHASAGGRIRVSAAVQAAWASSPQLLSRLATFASDNGLLLHAHCAETTTSGDRANEVHGCSELEALHRAGFLLAGTQLVHGVWFDTDDAGLVRSRSCGVVHCPVSNAYLGSGTAPVSMLRAHGIPVALGADGSASNHRQDPFESMKMATLLQRARTRDPRSMLPTDVLDMAWRGGAEVLRRSGTLGVLAPGAAADVIVVDLSAPHLQPLHDLAAALVFCAMPSDVRHVIVDGRVVVRDRVVTTVDVPALVRRCHDRAVGLGLRAGPTGGGTP